MQTNHSILRKLAQGRQKYGARLFLKRKVRQAMDSLFFRVDKAELLNSLRLLGLKQGMTVMVHSSVSRLGFVSGGPQTIIDALCEIVGSKGCVMMPTFSMSGSMKEYLEAGETFDCLRTPSHSGLLTETFRNMPGVIRSLHPTNSVAGWGEGVQEFIHDHHKSATPFGRETPFGRMAERDDTYILMIDTYIRSFLHHVQERVEYPNLFIEKSIGARMVDKNGKMINMNTRVLNPIIPYYVAIPSQKENEPAWVYLGDFALLFPTMRDHDARHQGYLFEGYPRILRRRKQLMETGIFTMVNIGRAEIGLLHIKPFLDIIEPELRTLLEQYGQHYDAQRIMDLHLPSPY
jgi:aminoglycoside N3'-acetyltransferase